MINMPIKGWSRYKLWIYETVLNKSYFTLLKMQTGYNEFFGELGGGDQPTHYLFVIEIHTSLLRPLYINIYKFSLV